MSRFQKVIAPRKGTHFPLALGLFPPTAGSFGVDRAQKSALGWERSGFRKGSGVCVFVVFRGKFWEPLGSGSGVGRFDGFPGFFREIIVDVPLHLFLTS